MTIIGQFLIGFLSAMLAAALSFTGSHWFAVFFVLFSMFSFYNVYKLVKKP